MKKIIYVIILGLFFNCDSKDGLDCFQTSGKIIQRTYNTEAFNAITVYERTQLIVKQGPQSIVLETGENLLNDISIKVIEGSLIIETNNSCNLFRDYSITKVFVTAPNISEIRNSSGLTVLSDGNLTYSNLSLISEDLEEEDAFHTNGDFNLDLTVENLTITQNNLSNFFLRGTVTNLDLNFLFGDARFEGRNLVVQNANIYHRGTNNIYINTQNSLVGSILSTGDIIALNRPPIVNIEELYKGKLIFED